MPRIDQLVKLAEAAGCTIHLNGRRYAVGGEEAYLSLRLGRRRIVFAVRGPFEGVEDDRVVNSMRALGDTGCRASLYEFAEGTSGSLQHITEFDDRHKAANVVNRMFAYVGAGHLSRSARFDIQGYGRGTPTVTLRSVFGDRRQLLDSIEKDRRVVRDPEGISLAYFRGDIDAGMFLDWLWDEVKL